MAPAILSRRLDPRAGVSVVWGMVRAGSAPNVIPHAGLVAGTGVSLTEAGSTVANISGLVTGSGDFTYRDDRGTSLVGKSQDPPDFMGREYNNGMLSVSVASPARAAVNDDRPSEGERDAVRADTKVGLEFQGLTGVPVIALPAAPAAPACAPAPCARGARLRSTRARTAPRCDAPPPRAGAAGARAR